MKKIKYYLEKYKILIILSILIIALFFSFFYTILRPDKKEEIKPIEIKEEVEEVVVVEEKIKVDIKGFVKEPGVYEMDNDSRVIDVIEKAGGLIDNANTDYINLSKKIIDEMIIIIYSNDQVEKFKEEEKEIIYIEYECICPDNINDTCITQEDTVNTNGIKEEKENSDETDNLVSINTGTLEELMKLNGIGESKAQAIIDYREKNGDFKNLEDIMNVSGIGESAYSKIKDNIKL
ncbi:MAG: ComEA family DNA-binding protein [Firmicutes bacterium]|nr:ComEA family DNA-binding protein [Bacillota bacterium]